ncbi:MAG: hypothetical protein ACRDSH_00915, partial [Pseudonocardiaceae bacterium]
MSDRVQVEHRSRRIEARMAFWTDVDLNVAYVDVIVDQAERNTMKRERSQAVPTVEFSATTTNAEREAANLEVIEGFFTALVKNKDPKAVAGYLADDFVSH